MSTFLLSSDHSWPKLGPIPIMGRYMSCLVLNACSGICYRGYIFMAIIQGTRCFKWLKRLEFRLKDLSRVHYPMGSLVIKILIVNILQSFPDMLFL